MKLVKVWNAERTSRVIVVANGLDRLISEGCRKLKITEEATTNVKVVLEKDGSEIDDDEIFKYLMDSSDDIIVILLKEGEIWTDPKVTQAAPTTPTSAARPQPDITPSPLMNQRSVETPPTGSSQDLTGAANDSFQMPLASYSIPWQKMEPRMLTALKNDRVPIEADRRFMVKVLVSDAVEKFGDKPSSEHLTVIARKVVSEFPNSFEDRILGSKMGVGYRSLFLQLRQRLENVRRPKAKTSLKRKLSVKEKQTGPDADSYGCVNWQPDSYPDGETSESQEDQRLYLAEQATLDVRERDPKCGEKMDRTYASQRFTINSEASTICTIQDRWPLLFESGYMVKHAEKLLGKDLEDAWRQTMGEQCGMFHRFLTVQRSVDVKEQFEELQSASVTPITERGRRMSVLPIMLVHFGEKMEDIFRKFKEGTQAREIESESSELPATPCIAVIGSNLYTAKYILMVEKKIGSELLNDLEKAVVMMFSAFYVLNLKYPESLLATMEFLQKVIFKIQPAKGSKRSGKKKRTDTHVKLLKLASDMSQFNLGIEG